MSAFVFLLFFFLSLGDESRTELQIGETHEGTISADDRPVHTKILDEHYRDALVVGKRYGLKITEPGTYVIDMLSRTFDTYLVLRDGESKFLNEDDDGLYGTHSRIVFQVEEGNQLYLVDACALHGMCGDFRLKVVAGKPPRLTRAQKIAAGLEDARQRVRIVQAEHGDSGPELAEAIYSLAGLLFNSGDFEEAQALYAHALDLVEAQYGAEHTRTIQYLNRFATVLYHVGEYARALPLFERALTIREQTLGIDHPRTAASLNNLAEVLKARGSLEKAGEFLERALQIYETKLGPKHPGTANCLNNLGGILHARGAYEAARPLLERAVAVYEELLGPDDPRTANYLNNLASVHQALGEYDQARPLLDRALRIRQEALGREHPHTAISLNNLATLMYQQGNFEESRRLFEEALWIQEMHFGAESPKVAVTLDNLATLWQSCGDFFRARPLCERALRLTEESFGPDHIKTAIQLNNLARLLKSQGEGGAARSLYERALEIFDRELGPDHSHIATILNNLAQLHRAAGAYEESRELLDRGLAIQTKALGVVHPTTARMTGNLVRLLSDLGEVESSWELAQDAAAVSETQLEQLLWSLPRHERLQYAAQKRKTLETLLSLAHATRTEDSRKVAYETLLVWKGRVSRSLLQSRDRLLRDRGPAARDLVDSLRSLQVRLSRELYTTEIEDSSDHQALLRRLKSRYNELVTELVRIGGLPEGPAPEVRLEGLLSAIPAGTALVDFLVHRWYRPARRAGGLVVEPGRWSGPHLSAWILRQGDSNLVQVDLGPVEAIEKVVRSFLDELIASRNGSGIEQGAGTRLSFQTANAKLRALLWRPLAVHLEGAAALVISPDTFLGTLPFEAIRLEDNSYLIEHHAIVYVTDMVSCLGREGRTPGAEDRAVSDHSVGPGMLAVGGVSYNHRADSGSLQKAASKGAPGGIVQAGTPEDLIALSGTPRKAMPCWQPLPGAELELQTVAGLHATLFGDTSSCQQLQGAFATEERIKAELPRCSMVHLATHGFFQPGWLPPSLWESIRNVDNGAGDPSRTARQSAGMLPGFLSGLVLAGANKPPSQTQDDGLLTAEEIAWLDLTQVELAVLSACETGLGFPSSGEGLLGLGRALQQAGAQSVITSLWKVDDQATRLLFSRFYGRLWQEGLHPAEALRAVKLDMIHGRIRPEAQGAKRGFSKPKKKAGDYSTPYYWASFVYWGRAP